ncbi:MAG: glycosyltransferase [Chloroflexi bacterium]|nr:glycosyltransferase [Chloroflexota bacterium]
MSLPFISVIIPAYNEEKYIEECLHSVFSLDYPRDKYEVIVVNNNSTDHTREFVAKLFPSVVLVDEFTQGIVSALITGTNASKGEILAYTDADSIVPALWLQRIAHVYEDPSVVAVGGSMRYKSRTILSSLSLIGYYPRYRWLKYMTGPNMTIRKSAYLQCGGFSLDVGYFDDAYISFKLKKIGKIVILSDNPVITSDRRLRTLDKDTIDYNIKAAIYITMLVIFGKPIPYTFKHIE